VERYLREEFITATYVEAERINIAADFFVKTASEQLSRRGQSPAAVLADIPATVVHRAFAMLPEIAAGRTPAGEFLALFGHRASHDFEISAPRYREAPAHVERMARSTPRVVPPARERIATAAATAAASTAATATPRQGRVLSLSLDRARRFQALKEAAKHEAMRELAVFRALTLEIARRTRLAERIFWLTPSEVAELRPECLRAGGVDAALDAVIEARIEAREACDSVDLPVRLTLADLEVMRLDDGPTLVRRDVVGQLGGKRVAGATEVIGRVRVVERVEDLESFVAGEVLVTRFTDPTWSTVFPIAGGLITEVGGWLSHAAIQAREYGLACIVDVAGAVGALETGDLVRLSLDGRVERIELAAESVVAAKVGVGANGGRLLRFGADAVAG
jgi:phosphohistidine swiveling domain-containing protein